MPGVHAMIVRQSTVQPLLQTCQLEDCKVLVLPLQAKHKRAASSEATGATPSAQTAAIQAGRSATDSTAAELPAPAATQPPQPTAQPSASEPGTYLRSDIAAQVLPNGHAKAHSDSSTSARRHAHSQSDSHAELDAAIDSAASQEDVPLQADASSSQPLGNDSLPGMNGLQEPDFSPAATGSPQRPDDEARRALKKGKQQQGGNAATGDFKALAGVLGLLLEQCTTMADSAAAQVRHISDVECMH